MVHPDIYCVCKRLGLPGSLMGERISLKNYYDEKFRILEKEMREKKDDMDKRLEGMNEFRNTLKDQASEFVTRDYLDTKIQILEKSRKDNLALVISLLTLLTSIIMYFIMYSPS